MQQNYWNAHGVFGMNNLACGCDAPMIMSVADCSGGGYIEHGSIGLFKGVLLGLAVMTMYGGVKRLGGSKAAALALAGATGYGGYKVMW